MKLYMHTKISVIYIFLFAVIAGVFPVSETTSARQFDRTEGRIVSETRHISAGNTTYYVDATGDDVNPGTSPHKAWKTLASVNTMKLAPGDKVLLKAGCEFAGPLVLHGSGAEGKPIVIDRYGFGANPIINGQGKVENTIRLHNQHDWEIRNLTVTNTDGGGWDDAGRAIRRAVYITAENIGDVKHIRLNNLEIRDVRGMYRFEGNTTNGGIICQVLGDKKPTRFVDLWIEGCVFRTKSIDRYPVVVTSSWGKQAPCKVVWKDNMLDHTGRAHIVIPASEWPREKVYYFCPECREVFGLNKTMTPVCGKCGRVGVEDIFSEMAARLKRSWNFFEATRLEPERWLFSFEPNNKDVYTGTYPLAYYGEVRALGFVPPWLDPHDKNMREEEDYILREWVGELVKRGLKLDEDWNIRNRVFMNESKWARQRTEASFVKAISQYGVAPDLSTRDKALAYFKSLPWASNPYGACNFIGKTLHRHRRVLIARGEDPDDDIYYYVKALINGQFQPDKGYWGGQRANHINRTSGNMKMMTTYAALDWDIPYPKKIIDFHLSGADEKAGFRGRGCSAFNQMFPLAAIRRKYPELASYRGDQIDKYTAMTFMTFLSNWNEKLNFYGSRWDAKHNHGVVMFISHLMLDQPYMRSSTIYNWREGPIITRKPDGGIEHNLVIYTRKGFPYDGGG